MKRKNILKATLTILLCLAMLFSMTACTKNDTPTDKDNTNPTQSTVNDKTAESNTAETDDSIYKFALMAPLTGNNAQYGQSYKITLELLVEKVNAGGGIDGHQIQLDVYDDKGDAKESVNIATKIADDPDVLAVIGSQTSSCSMAAAPILQEKNILMISPQASHVDYTSIGDCIFRTQVTTAHENAETARFLVETLGAQKIAFIYSSDDWGVSMLETMTAAANNLGAEIVAAETYIAGETKDFTPLISKIKQSEPDVLFLASVYADAVQIIQQCKNLNVEIPYVGSNTLFKQEFLDVGGADVEGVMMSNTVQLNNDNEEYLWLEEAYKEKTGNFIDSYVTQSYDALNVVLKAIEAVGPDRDAMKGYLANLTDYVGVSGTFSYDEVRNAAKTVYIYEIKDGAIVDWVK